MKALALLLFWAATAVALRDRCSEEITFARCDNSTLKFRGAKEKIRYGYDKHLHRCIPFASRNCGPQRNKFMNKKQCEKTCGQPADFCSKPLVQGPCLASLRRFGYDPTAKKCVKFTYGGCDGNENNFATRAECRETCKDYSTYDPRDVCKLPAERGPCMDNIPSYAYDSQTGKCVYFSYSGCGGNDNRFETKKECMKMCKPKSEEQDVCSLPVVAGPCTDAYTRYAYNSKKQKCVKFRFGGCEGNANNFETLEDCQSVCGGGTTKPTKPGQGTCLLSIEAGPCEGNERRYAYDVKQQKCVAFKYGGCLGNENNFETLKKCRSLCDGVVDPTPSGPGAGVCALPISTGKCRAALRRYGYDSTLKKCVCFIYGGCEGNANRFETLEDCQSSCEQQDAPSTIPGRCLQEIKVGPCRGEFPRYAYDSTQKECVPFTYGGCRGNTNRFMTLNECQSVCMGRESTVVPSIPDDCTLPIRAGRCRYNLTRYGYDIVQKKCVEFVYSGCGANTNNFRKLSDCQAVCEGGVPTPDPTPSPKGVCSLPIEVGPCKAYIPSYAYNNELKKCVLFIYGGCEGNENRFETLKDCQSVCEKEEESTTAPSVVPEVCTLPIKSGPCYAIFPRYAYDSSQKRCVRFIYGGCQGNGNNFGSLEECQSTCMGVEPTPSPESTPTTDVCLLPIVTGRCMAFIPKYAYNSAKKRCVQFIYGGCEGNENKFDTLEECQSKCMGVGPSPTIEPSTPSPDVCTLPITSGPCSRFHRRYAYDYTRNKCVPFFYGGCQGNENNFETLKDCQSVCMGGGSTPTPTPPTPSEVCSLPIERGPCLASITSYAYDSTQKKCVEFEYGGCEGNENRFDTLKDCQSVCETGTGPSPKPGPEVCTLPTDVGPCKALIPKYTYNTKTQKCVLFYFGGCQGNGNNFETLEECKSTCEQTKPTQKPSAEICSQPVKTGPCYAKIQRYAYSTSQQKCIEFTFGGCNQNDNNFETMEECAATCEQQATPTPTPEPEPETDICKLAPDSGYCNQFVIRYAYVSRQKKCMPLIYGGCGGNKNNFPSKEACEAKCMKSGTNVCTQPIDVGPCKALVLRYAYDIAKQKCTAFFWGGCEENGNNFETSDDCISTCEQHKPNPDDEGVCSQSIDAGPCKGDFERYAFDSKTRTCVQFVYGGCKGNTNNFETWDDCASTCGLSSTPQPEDVCQLDIDPGPCKANLTRYAYNKTSKQCVEFTYGGCKGNDNHFLTMQECISRCAPQQQEDDVCSLPLERGTGKGIYTLRYGYNATLGRCVPFFYTLKGGNKNNFHTMALCERSCGTGIPTPTPTPTPIPTTPGYSDVCSLPINRGTGKRVFALRYAYNSAKGVCEPFMYSLKGGNKNNFYTKELCERACGTATPTPTPSTPDYGDICSLPLERGTGREEYVTRYGYDSSKGKCVSFPYSLKGGNANNFYSMALCEQICGTGPIITPETTTTTTPTTPVSRERCSLPIERGPCESYVPRFAYDSNTQSCVLFYYGGCLGNDNRFRTLRGCQYTCMYGQQTTMPTESPWQTYYRCKLPIRRGNCNEQLVRYGYSNYDCVQFIYTGCDGNANNFETLDECRRTCGWYTYNSSGNKMRAPRRRIKRI